MKKKILLILAIVAMFTCLLVVSVSADTIVPSDNNAFGTLTIFDEAIGNTSIAQTKDDGTVARTVLYDSAANCYYTVPTTYILKHGTAGGKEIFELDFSTISTKLKFTVSKSSIIRSEIPSNIAYVNNDSTQSYRGCSNLIEVVINDGLRIWDNSERKIFTGCTSLKSIDMSGMVLTGTKNVFAMFENCSSLERVVLPDAYFDGEKYIDYDTSHMFSKCNNLKTIENLEGFFKGDKTLDYKTFYNCNVLTTIYINDGVTTILGRAFGNCKAITSVVIPDSVTQIGTTETVFESCTSLKTIVLPKKASFGDYCFEKCTGLTDVWMPTEASTFGKQAFGQIGSDRQINFYFQTAVNTITVANTDFNKDPYLDAVNKGDARLKFSTPLSTKCTVFLGGHTRDAENSNNCVVACSSCKTLEIKHNETVNLLVSVVYTDYTQAGTKVTACQNTGCTHSYEESLAALIRCDGYSVDETNGNGIVVGYVINEKAIKTYTELTGKTVKYGLYAATKEALRDNYIIGEDGMPTDGAVKAEVNEGFIALELKICGITDKEALFALGAYLEFVDENGSDYEYIEDGEPTGTDKYYFVSYNSVANA